MWTFLFSWFLTLMAALATPCAAEDGPAPCYWDAQTQGNGQGTSALVLNEG